MSSSFFSFHSLRMESENSFLLLLLLHFAAIVASAVVGGWLLPKKIHCSAATGLGGACLVVAFGLFFTFLIIMQQFTYFSYSNSRGLGAVIFLIFPIAQVVMALVGGPFLLLGLRNDRKARENAASTQTIIGTLATAPLPTDEDASMSVASGAPNGNQGPAGIPPEKTLGE